MTVYSISIDHASECRLRAIAQEMDRTIESLIEAAAEEATLEYFRHRADDPGRKTPCRP